MAARTTKLQKMDDCERDRQDAAREQGLRTPMQMALGRKRDDNVARVRGMLREPFDPEVQERGIADARAAMRRGNLHVLRDEDGQTSTP